MTRFIYWWRFRRKARLDRKLFGQVYVPRAHCPGCGYPILDGHSVAGAKDGLYHEHCI